jgi:hypothetical protein
MKVLLGRIAALSESSGHEEGHKDGHRIEIGISALNSADAGGQLEAARVLMGTLRNSAS